MRLLIVGTGGVGESVAVLAARRDPEGGLFERVVLADADLARAERVSRRLGEQRFPAERVDGTDSAAIAALAARHRADIVCNFLPLWANVHVMEAALQAGTHYLDTAFGVDPEPLPGGGERPWFDAFQLDYRDRFEGIGRLALLGQGVEPGMADYFARYAADHFFDEVEEMGVRDGSNLAIPGFEGIAFGFSVWSTIDELTCPAIVWEAGKGVFEVEPFSDREPFLFPEGIGAVTVSNVAHDEVVHIGRHAGLLKGVRKATFKYGLGDEFEAAMGVLKSLNLHEVDPVKVVAADGRHVMVAPRDLVAAASPDPAEIGKRFVGKTAAGLWGQGQARRPRARGLPLSGGRQPGVCGDVRHPGGGVPDGLHGGHHAGVAVHGRARRPRRQSRDRGPLAGGVLRRPLRRAHGRPRLPRRGHGDGLRVQAGQGAGRVRGAGCPSAAVGMSTATEGE